MPEYLAPGVYLEEISTGPRPIEGVGTSTAGFVGAAERGPEFVRLVTSWLDFTRWYGRYIPQTSYLPDAIQGFFENGGQRCFVTRVVSGVATLALLDVGGLNVMAVGRGDWGNRVRIKVDDATQRNASNNWFRVSILYYAENPQNFIDPTSTHRQDLTNRDRRTPEMLEVFDNLSVVSGASNNVVTVLNAGSKLVRVQWADPNTQNPLPNQPFTELAGGSDGDPLTVQDYQGDTNPMGGTFPTQLFGRGRGLQALELVDEVALLLVPDEVRSGLETLSGDVINQCSILKDRFGVISAVAGQTEAQQISVTTDTSYAGYYYPWIRIFDATINTTRLIPPSGHVAGIIARSDQERGVHKAPANEVVRGALDLELPVPKGAQEILNPKGINCIRDFRSDGRGIRLWGARTMASDAMWKYVNVRRLFIFVEEAIDEGTQWVVFEPNHEPTWAAVRRTISNFLLSVWRSGALMGQTADEAFFVRCDRTTMTQDDIDNGRLICYIGIAPVKPAEFVIFRISQKTSEAEA